MTPLERIARSLRADGWELHAVSGAADQAATRGTEITFVACDHVDAMPNRVERLASGGGTFVFMTLGGRLIVHTWHGVGGEWKCHVAERKLGPNGTISGSRS